MKNWPKLKLVSHYVPLYGFIYSYFSPIYHFGPNVALFIYFFPIFSFIYLYLPTFILICPYLVILKLPEDKPDLSDLENDLLCNSMKYIYWQLINIIPKKLYTRNKEKLSDRFWENWQKVAKQPKLTFFGPCKMTLKVIQSNPSFGSPSAPSLGGFMTK